MFGCLRETDGSWINPHNGEQFSKRDTVLNHTTRNFSFFDVPETWNESVHGTPRVAKQIMCQEEGGNRCWGDGYITNTSEVYFSVHPLLNRYVDSSVIVVGAGPSTNDCDWQSVDAKHVWSMNHFYLNDAVANDPRLNLITLGNEVDFDNPKLNHIILTNPNMLIYQEPCFVKKNYQPFIDKWSDRMGWYHLRYCSKLGQAPRMILLAIFAGAKEIFTVGFDGYTPDMKAKHAFQDVPDQKEGYNYEIWRMGMVIFWEYVFELQKAYNFTIYNLGHGHPSNMSTALPHLEYKR